MVSLSLSAATYEQNKNATSAPPVATISLLSRGAGGASSSSPPPPLPPPWGFNLLLTLPSSCSPSATSAQLSPRRCFFDLSGVFDVSSVSGISGGIYKPTTM